MQTLRSSAGENHRNTERRTLGDTALIGSRLVARPSLLYTCRLLTVTSRVLVTSTPIHQATFKQLRSYRYICESLDRNKEAERRESNPLRANMGRPTDSYTHSQFSITDENADPRKSTVRCNHCKSWTGNIRSLDRKKMHLTKCIPYCDWRAAGNGEELQPSQVYSKRGRISQGHDQQQ